ncbi:WecB/TagA/CpsF family glycosyltransferase [Rhodococcus sp. SORGH_AS_0303]|uniref:WecB/TagA/CpsF family glycosyltransferase n=1 Tax=Rhodococcus sp. SORGH_AS_0303 TaxID=3041753 RepID=UPI0027D7A2B4|nr:WecB/TagA/CpsF family glycosyltransferase [Rhodococcus sp. SORGH_AS_0303]
MQRVAEKAARYLPWFDITVHPLDSEDIVRLVLDTVESRETLWLSNFNLHGVYLYQIDPDYRDAVNAAHINVIDGWPVLAATSLVCRRRFGAEYRVGSSDWLRLLLARSSGLRIVAVGATPESSRRGAEVIAAGDADVTWNAYDGYHFAQRDDSRERMTLRRAVAEADIVLVGMGMPHQERWITENADMLRGKVVANVGGCLDYLSGVQREAPRWLGRYGLEWLYRLVQAPRRLCYRYVAEPVLLSRHVVRRALRSASGTAD